MLPDTLRPRLQLALGGEMIIADEQPALGGRRVYTAHAPEPDRLLRVTLHPAPPEGPLPRTLRDKIARLTALDHASMILPIAVGEIEGRAWVVEPDADGVTAAACVAERGPRPVREAVRVVRDVARALAAMHRRGLAHGALGPDTVLLTPEGTRIVGLALSDGGSAGDDLDGLAEIARSLFYGTHPGSGALRRHLPPEIAALLKSMAADDPARRPQRAEAVLGVLDTFPVEQSSALGALIDSAGRGARSRPMHTTFGVLILVGVILLVLAFLAAQR
jgi:serine/threonine protein kinase